MLCIVVGLGIFFFNDTATTEIYTLSLHDALPISEFLAEVAPLVATGQVKVKETVTEGLDNAPEAFMRSESTRLNSSHPSRSRMPSSA